MNSGAERQHSTGERWQEAVPKGAKMTGEDYRDVWLRLAGSV
uniref:Uncharacterized protein n=1 Tax=uncultured Desulfobacterium sp. TaxID=201089 RepID=E1YMT8_9BACT|nr:unknown protein [uncultured Desulfobacterium sp.]